MKTIAKNSMNMACSCMLTHNFTVRVCIQKFPEWVDNETYASSNKHSLRNNTKGYGGKTH
jgi:hypothetical protein